MSPGDKKGSIHSTSVGGVVGSHPEPDAFPLLVAPSTADESNTARLRLIPIACFRIDDVRFKFDSSFVLPDAKAEMNAFTDLRKKDPRVMGAPISIFGHADPSFQGNFERGSSTANSGDDYNKTLSGRRALAVYAMLIRDPSFWNALFSHHLGGDVWGEDSIRIMLDATDAGGGSSAASSQGSSGSAQNSRVRDIAHDAGQRQQLFLKYMDVLCGDLKLDKSADFLARGAGPDQKGDVQGCSRFNPLLLFNAEDEARFKTAFAKKDEAVLRGERDPNNSHNRRVMILVFRKGSQVLPAKWPCPTYKEGPAGCKKRFFSDGDTRRSTHTPGAERKFDDTHDTFACRFYQRISDNTPCEAIIPRIPPSIEFVFGQANKLSADENDPATLFVRMGLWDHAFDSTGAVLNKTDEKDNFAGADTRRFYIRVRDTAASNRVTVKWRTLKQDGTDLDAPASQDLTLQETSNGSHVFVSRALMLVSEENDQKQSCDSGLPSGTTDAGDRKQGESNHRTRRGSMFGTVVAEYTSIAGGAPVSATAQVFDRSPEERRRMPLQIFVVRVAVGGAPIVSTAATGSVFATDLRVIRDAYERIGIRAETVVSPTLPATAKKVTVGSDSIVEIDPPAGINVGNMSFADESTLGTANPALADTIRVFYIGGLSSGAGGETWTDAITSATDSRRAAAFVIPTTGPYAAAHEIGHALSNKQDATEPATTNYASHFKPPTVPAGNRLRENQNLMFKNFLGAEAVNGAKHLWDDNDANSFNQFTAMRGSHYTRNI
jgi:hypothetical protein